MTGSVDAKPFGRCDNRWVTTGWGSYLRTIRPLGGTKSLQNASLGRWTAYMAESTTSADSTTTVL